MIQVFSFSSWKEVVHLFGISSNQLFSVSGRLSPHNFEMFSISPQQAYSFRCWFSNNSVQSFFVRMLFKFNCGRSCHFLLRSFLSNNLASILSFRRHCDDALFFVHLRCVLCFNIPTSKVLWFHSFVKEATLFYLFLFLFSFLDLGARSLVSGWEL